VSAAEVAPVWFDAVGDESLQLVAAVPLDRR
jgi:hypothetical protein